MSNASQLDHQHQRVDESHAFWTIFVLGFIVFFAIAAIATLLGINWRNYLPGAEGTNGLFAGVKAAVYTFMSHIT
jgi:light-harvesting complex 1 beta chain